MLWRLRKHAFRYPVGDCPRIAILADWFARRRREVSLEDSPAAIAGTREQLLALAAEPTALTHAVIALARPGEPLLSASERDQLWQAFHVPVFEQVIGDRGKLLAFECEAHDGLHVVAQDADWSAYAIDETPCECGNATARIAVPAEAAMRAGTL